MRGGVASGGLGDVYNSQIQGRVGRQETGPEELVRPLIWKMQAPPLAWPVRVFWEITKRGLPSDRPMASGAYTKLTLPTKE
ncbi:hypothetical protein CRD60_08500 [Bifidobacterium aemilianum]|uniref:Uncharacterized protein n=1 Tax=Bifidobacterium aemilianum TaxID=2493120 RepID=A0A366K7M7_9BIFI|nr:hypothetical protein CRD60_08500 [Bifidobacterium aemilianum]